MPVVTNAAQPAFTNHNVTARGLVNAETGATQSSLMVVTYEPKGYMGPHYHDQEQIMYCLEGEGLVYFENNPLALQVGQTALIPAGMRHAVFNTGAGPFRLAVFSPAGTLTTHWLTKNRRAILEMPFVRSTVEADRPAAGKANETKKSAA